MPGRSRRAARLLYWGGAVAALAGVGNFLRAVQNGLTFTRGDFYYTLPGEYAARLNPTLWNSPDIQLAIEYNRGAYFYGPTQYLTLFPIVFLDSYEQIARVLLATHALALVAAFVVLWRLLSWRERPAPGLLGLLFGAVFLYRPLAQAYVQREFEIIALLILVGTVSLLARGREGWGSGLLAYLAWFKYWPMVFVGYLLTALRWRALAIYGAACAGVLGVAHALFGLQHFALGQMLNIISWMFRPLGTPGEEILSPVPGAPYKEAFCRQWVPGRGTQASVRWAFCGIEDAMPWFPARELFYALLVLVGAVIVLAGWRLARQPFDEYRRKWAVIWQMSLLTIAGATFLHAHYYYLTLLILPMAALLFRYASGDSAARARLAVWGAAYLALTAFIVPLPVLSALLQRDAWAFYMTSGLYAAGILALTGLVMLETIDVHLRGRYAHRA